MGICSSAWLKPHRHRLNDDQYERKAEIMNTAISGFHGYVNVEVSRGDNRAHRTTFSPSELKDKDRVQRWAAWLFPKLKGNGPVTLVATRVHGMEGEPQVLYGHLVEWLDPAKAEFVRLVHKEELTSLLERQERLENQYKALFGPVPSPTEWQRKQRVQMKAITDLVADDV